MSVGACAPKPRSLRAIGDRFAIRFSNAPFETRSTISVEHPYQVPDDAILCPEQIGRAEILFDLRALLPKQEARRLPPTLGQRSVPAGSCLDPIASH